MRWAAPARLIVRPPSAAFSRALTVGPNRPDPVAAASQHKAYVAALERAGLTVHALPASDHPDGCFVEDPVVVLGPAVVRTRSAVASRRGEAPAILTALDLPVWELPPEATLDGGDVLRVADRLFVGQSARTNAAGVAALSALAARVGLSVTRLDVPAGLHLKSACSLAGPDWLVYDPRVLSADVLAPIPVERLAVPEPFGANVLALGARTLVSAAAPRTADLLSRRREVEVVDVSALHAADGALTCLSVRVPAEGAWAT
ncbi:MAG: dimethylargininase [Myxococcota bacterium]|jgi:dimethylargininase